MDVIVFIQMLNPCWSRYLLTVWMSSIYGKSQMLLRCNCLSWLCTECCHLDNFRCIHWRTRCIHFNQLPFRFSSQIWRINFRHPTCKHFLLKYAIGEGFFLEKVFHLAKRGNISNDGTQNKTLITPRQRYGWYVVWFKFESFSRQKKDVPSMSSCALGCDNRAWSNHFRKIDI